MRDCGCEDRGRHKRTCLKHIERKEAGWDNQMKIPSSIIFNIPAEECPQGDSLHELYIAGYGKPPQLFWYPNKDRQRTVERRIEKLVRRYKAFYLTTSSLDNPSEEEEIWFIDGGNWASKKDSDGYNILVGHINNCLEFLDGHRPLWRNRRIK